MEGKDTKGKPTLGLVPIEILYGIERVREFGLQKYKDPENWKKVSKEDYWQALLRHVVKAWDDMDKVDDESGLPHLWHIACNLAFIIALEKDGNGSEKCKRDD